MAVAVLQLQGDRRWANLLRPSAPVGDGGFCSAPALSDLVTTLTATQILPYANPNFLNYCPVVASLIGFLSKTDETGGANWVN